MLLSLSSLSLSLSIYAIDSIRFFPRDKIRDYIICRPKVSEQQANQPAESEGVRWTGAEGASGSTAPSMQGGADRMAAHKGRMKNNQNLPDEGLPRSAGHSPSGSRAPTSYDTSAVMYSVSICRPVRSFCVLFSSLCSPRSSPRCSSSPLRPLSLALTPATSTIGLSIVRHALPPHGRAFVCDRQKRIRVVLHTNIHSESLGLFFSVV